MKWKMFETKGKFGSVRQKALEMLRSIRRLKEKESSINKKNNVLTTTPYTRKALIEARLRREEALARAYMWHERRRARLASMREGFQEKGGLKRGVPIDALGLIALQEIACAQRPIINFFITDHKPGSMHMLNMYKSLELIEPLELANVRLERVKYPYSINTLMIFLAGCGGLT